MYFSNYTLSLLLAFFTFFILCSHSGAQTIDAAVISKKTIITISDGEMTENYFYEIMINNRSGDKYAEISIPYDKLTKVSGIEASICDLLGNEIQKLRKSDIVDRSNPSYFSFYEDSYVKQFSLRNHNYPYILKYSYKHTSKQFLTITNWSPVEDTDIPTLDAILEVNVPSDYKISYREYNCDIPKVESKDNITSYTWTSTYQKIIKPEELSPPVYTLLPRVHIVPENFLFDIPGNMQSWRELGNWQLKLLNGLNDLPASEIEKIKSLVNDGMSDQQKAKALFYYLQRETRYVNVTITTGGMKPYPASYVATKKYGDCKALTNYYIAALSVLGIKAYYSEIYADDQIFTTDSTLPSQQFNHVIACLPINNDTLWVDCTSDLAFGYLGTFTQNRHSLVNNQDSSRLVKTPALTLSDVNELRVVTVKQPDQTLSKAEFNTTFRGKKYELLMLMRTTLDESEFRKYLNKLLVASIFEVNNYTIQIPDPDIPEVQLNYEAISPNLRKNYGKETLLQILPFDLPDLPTPKQRKLPVQIDYPINQADSLIYVIPEGYKLAALPDDQTLSSEYGSYSAHYQQSGVNIIIKKQFTLSTGSYPLSEYATFYKFINDVSEKENSSYISLNKP